MEIIKRKISLDDYTSRESSNWGKMTATTFNINVFFTQDGDDMGISTEAPFIEKSQANSINLLSAKWLLLTDKLNASGYTFNFMTGAITNTPWTAAYPNTRYPGKAPNQYYVNGSLVSGYTDDKLDVVESYDATAKYKVGFDMTKNINAIDYQNTPFTSGTRVITYSTTSPITYLIEGDTSPTAISALPITTRGVYYSTNTTGKTRTISGTIFGKYNIPFTTMYYTAEGLNGTNVHLSADTKEEYLFGITETPKVFNDLFIDRGRATVIQSHMQLSEIRNMAELINYGNGFYNLRRY